MVGALLIGKGFESGGSLAAPRTNTSPSTGPTSTPTTPTTPATPPTTAPAKKNRGPRRGVVIGIYNGTSAQGLAAITATSLKHKYGYVLGKVTTALSPSSDTLIYYRHGSTSLTDAHQLQQVLFLKAKVQPLPSTAQDVPASVELAVVLGADYLRAHPLH